MRFSEVHAIWRREVKKVLADRAALLLSVVWPLFLIFVIGIGFDSFVELRSIETGYTSFLGPGIIALMAMGGAVRVGNSLVREREGFVKELLVAPISRPSIFVGKILGGMTTSIVVTSMVVFIFLESVSSVTLAALGWALLFILLLEFTFYSIGLVLGFFFRAGTYQQFFGIFNAVLMFLSGAFFPIGNLPAPMKALSYINPLTYGVDGLRGQMVGVAHFSLATDVTFLLFFAAIMTVAGSAFFRRSIEAF